MRISCRTPLNISDSGQQLDYLLFAGRDMFGESLTQLVEHAPDCVWMGEGVCPALTAAIGTQWLNLLFGFVIILLYLMDRYNSQECRRRLQEFVISVSDHRCDNVVLT